MPFLTKWKRKRQICLTLRMGRLIHKRLAATALAMALCSTAAAAEVSTTAKAGAQAHRIITLTPHATELVYAAGGGHLIVGTVSSSDYPEAARNIPRLGDGILLNQERILVLRPTLFVGWLRSGVALQVEALAAHLGADMLYSRPSQLADIPADVRALGERLGNPLHAIRVAANMEARIRAMESRYTDRTPVSVFIEVGASPLYTIGDDPLLQDAMRLCGGVNIYGDSGMPAPRVTVESVLVHQPQLLIASGRDDQTLQAVRERWVGYGLEAARLGRIHLANPDALYRPGPRFLDAAEELCAAIDKVRESAGQG